MRAYNLHVVHADDVARFLGERGWGEVHDLSRIAHGEWSKAFAFTAAADRQYVVRFSRVDEDFRKDAFAARFSNADLPMPRIVELGAAFDGYYAISERAHGVFLDSLDSESLRAALPSLFAALDAMRTADVSATLGYGLWDATGTARHASWRETLLDERHDPRGRMAGWRQALEQSPTGATPFDAALTRLERLAADVPDARHLVHSDLLNYNVLLDGNRLSAVLDWGSAMYGDWLWDLAWLVFFQPWYPGWADIDFAAEAQRHFAATGLQVPEFELRLRCCTIAIGLDDQTYCAFKGAERWPQLAAVAERTLAFATS